MGIPYRPRKRPLVGRQVVIYGCWHEPPEGWPPSSWSTATTTGSTSTPAEQSPKGIFDDGLAMVKAMDAALEAHPAVSRKRLIAALVAAHQEDLTGLAAVLAGEGEEPPDG